MQIKNTGHLRKKRLIVVLSLLLVLALYVITRYGIYAFTEPSKQAFSMAFQQRGSILDRNGKALAVPTNFYHFTVTPSAVKNNKDFAELVSPYIGLSVQEIIQELEEQEKARYTYLKKNLSQDTADILKQKCKENGFGGAVKFDKMEGRVYPENDLASQLVGFLGVDGKGLAGIELSREDTLAPYLDEEGKLQPGKNIVLTIDATLQSTLEKIAQDAMENTKAQNLMLIAAEAKTGEILSYISLPSANLNEYSTATDEERKDRPAIDGYEPGSVFKIFSVAAFLDAGAISTDEIFNCDGIYEKHVKSGEAFRITCLDHHGWQDAKKALENSCNDALAQMSEKLDSEPFLVKLRELGFGSKTGVEVPSEATGIVRNTSDRLWSARSKPTIAIGQEITVTALQMVQAATAIANGGVPVQLTFINKIVDSEGQEEYIHTPFLRDRIFKESTARYLLSCMESVAKVGTGHRASIKDVSIGVKTGTAQMADPVTGKYSKTDFISNCISMFPIEDPEIILYIVIEKAQGETYAGRIVAPVIAEAANAIIDYRGMSRGDADSMKHNGLISIKALPQLNIGETVPDFTGMPKRQLLPLLDRTDLQVKINGDGWVTGQTPQAGTPLTEKMTIELYLE